MNLLRQNHVIDGKSAPPASGEYIEVIDPVSGEVIAQTAAGNKEDVDLAVHAARAAFKAWSKSAIAERARFISCAGLKLGEHLEEILTLEASGTGIPMARLQAFDVPAVMQFVQTFSEKLEDYPLVEYPPVRPLPEAHHVKIVKRPLGVCGLIPAWNGPLFLAFVKLLPAVAAGNTVVIKPAESASLAVVRAIELLQDIFPSGVINVVTGRGPEAGQALAAHPDVDKISFTGSTRTGKLIQATAAESLKRVTLELGGKGPGIVLPDAPLELTARGATFGFLLNSGQICVSGTRLFVHDSIHDALVERMIALCARLKPGSAFDAATTLGPMAFKDHYKRVLDYLAIGKAEGAVAACGGEPLVLKEFPNGLFIKPTIFTGVDPSMRIFKEEIFGPVLCVTRYSDVEEAIAMANDSCFGLSAGIWTGNPIAAQDLAEQIEAGTVWINDWHALTADMSFGGIKQSGYGREINLASMEGYLETRNYMTSFETNPDAKALHGLLHRQA